MRKCSSNSGGDSPSTPAKKAIRIVVVSYDAETATLIFVSES